MPLVAVRVRRILTNKVNLNVVLEDLHSATCYPAMAQVIRRCTRSVVFPVKKTAVHHHPPPNRLLNRFPYPGLVVAEFVQVGLSVSVGIKFGHTRCPIHTTVAQPDQSAAAAHPPTSRISKEPGNLFPPPLHHTMEQCAHATTVYLSRIRERRRIAKPPQTCADGH